MIGLHFQTYNYGIEEVRFQHQDLIKKSLTATTSFGIN